MSKAPHLDDKKLLVGKINGFFGLQGWVKLLSYTDPRKNILSYQPWYFLSDGVYEKIEVTNGREQSKTIVAHIKDVDNREQSQVFIGKDIYIDKEQLPKLNPGEHYWYEMIGFEVINQHNEKLGVVDYFVETGSNNVLVTKGKKGYWIPYIEPFLISTNAETKQIIVDWDEDF